MTETKRREQLIRAYYSAVDTESYADFEDLMTATVRHVRPGQGLLRGGAAVRDYYETERDSTNTAHEIEAILHDDDRTLCLVEVSGETPAGPFVRPVVGAFTFDDDADLIDSYTVYRGEAVDETATGE